MAAAAPAAGPSGAVLDSMQKSNGAGGAGFKGGLQVVFGGKEFPSVFSGFAMDIQKGFGFKFEEVSPKFLSGHMGVAPNILPGFGEGLLKGKDGSPGMSMD